MKKNFNRFFLIQYKFNLFSLFKYEYFFLGFFQIYVRLLK